MAKETKYIVGDKGYVSKGGKVYQTGQEISLTDAEAKNVEKFVVKASTDEGKQLLEQRQESEQTEENESK